MSLIEIAHTLSPEEYERLLTEKKDDIGRRNDEGAPEEELKKELIVLRKDFEYYRDVIFPERKRAMIEAARASEVDRIPPQILNKEEPIEDEQEDEEEWEEGEEDEEEEEEEWECKLERFVIALLPLYKKQLDLDESDPDFAPTDEDIKGYLTHIIQATGARSLAELETLDWEKVLTQEDLDEEPELPSEKEIIHPKEPEIIKEDEDLLTTSEDVAHHLEPSTDNARDELFIGEEGKAESEEVEKFDVTVSTDGIVNVDRHRENSPDQENSRELKNSFEVTVSTDEDESVDRQQADLIQGELIPQSSVQSETTTEFIFPPGALHFHQDTPSLEEESKKGSDTSQDRLWSRILMIIKNGAKRLGALIDRRRTKGALALPFDSLD